jgi:uncharacterized damage-inducible protein DinB
VSEPFPDPTAAADSLSDVLLGYLEFFRSRVVTKISELPESALNRSTLPSGWTPLGLLKHLRYVELRWLEWGFQGRDIADPWADSIDGRWHVDDDDLEILLAALLAQATRTSAVIRANDLQQTGRPSARWEGSPPPTLQRILLHLIQEYARHLGQLDVVVELATGQTGE